MQGRCAEIRHDQDYRGWNQYDGHVTFRFSSLTCSFRFRHSPVLSHCIMAPPSEIAIRYDKGTHTVQIRSEVTSFFNFGTSSIIVLTFSRVKNICEPCVVCDSPMSVITCSVLLRPSTAENAFCTSLASN